ncbi:MAG: HesA/MoeB/ThiF family protein [Desulfobacterales bacterium]|nr:HesA/MoeB/ThiF family protein [Desulfobacterales bacterium]MDD3081097.1 HesA/MoeB/ThiF family protein [Desulfobacterales bacterium]MDD3950212.1 HesA/MoeB/ThiF family protein [Desulfobacterales bacterium]
MTDSKSHDNLTRLLREKAAAVVDPAGRKVDVIKDNQATALAEHLECSLAAVYTRAMNLGIWPYRYIRNRDTLSLDDQLRLAGSRVAVIGAGGLGGHLILVLARLGVGHITVVDPDVFDETNLNRQALSTMANAGKSKANEAVRAAAEINPAVETRSLVYPLNRATAPGILKNMDVAVDALDSIRDRLVLQKAAHKHGIPMVHGAIAGFAGQVMTILPGDLGLKHLYGNKTPANKSARKNAESILGVPAPTPCLIAGLQAMEVVKLLLNRGRTFRNRLMCVDLESGFFNEVSFETAGSSNP